MELAIRATAAGELHQLFLGTPPYAIPRLISIGGSQSQSRQESQSDTARGSTVTAAGNIHIQAVGAGKDSNLTIQGSVVEAGRNVQLSADNEIKLQAAKNTATQNSTNTSSSSSLVRGAGTDFLEDRQSADVGSQINTQGSLALQAGRDLNAKAATVQAAGDLTAVAGNNINITAGQQTNSSNFGLTTSESDLFSSSSTTERRSGEQSNAVGSNIGGKTVTAVAGNDLGVKGSSVISDVGTRLGAGNNLSIEAAKNTSKSSDFKETKESGLMSSGGVGVTIGSLEQSLDQKTSGTTAAASTVGSIGGNVTLQAGNAYKQVGSDVQAPGGNIDITAKKVDIVEARETSQTTVEQKFKQSGLTLEVVSPVLSALQTAQQMSEAAGNTSDGRMKGLAAANTAFAAKKAADAIEKGQGTTINGKDGQIPTKVDSDGKVLESRDANAADKAGGIDLAISIGGSQSQSRQESQSDTARGSTVTAAGNIHIQAIGAGQDSNLTIQGSTVDAGRAVQLKADNEIKLLAAKNTTTQNSTNSSSSSSVGISYGTNGLMFNASGSKGSGKADGTDTSNTNTEVKAGNQAALTSGGNTTLEGALVKADQIKADVGGNLKIVSPQDTSTYTSEQKNASASVSIGYGNGSASVSASKSNINSDFKSVGEQSGLKAGDGGFQVNVQGNTDLKGGVIASTEKAVQESKNSFSTGGTLTTTELQNSASYEGKASGFSLGGGPVADMKGITGLGIGLGSDKKDASSTTSAGISGIAGNTAVRSTDAETGLKPIFDADKVQREIDAQVQITQAFTRDATKAVGDFAQGKLNEARDLRNRATTVQDPERATELNAQAQALEDTWGEGKTGRVLLHTLVGGLSGGLAGAAGAATSQSVVPLLGEQIAQMDIPPEVKSALIAAAGTAIGAATGGTAGAISGLTATTNNYLSHAESTKRQELKDKQRRGQSLSEAEQKTLDDLEVLDIVRDLALRNACKVQGDACNAARRDLNAALGTYSGAAAMADPRLSSVGNVGVTFDKNYALSVGNEPNLAAQTLLDSFKEFALPQVGGYLVGAALGAYINEARAIYAAIKADLNAEVVSGTVAGSIRNVNPGYPATGRTENCVNCTVATDATLSGSPAAALPSNAPVGIRVLEQHYGSRFGPATTNVGIEQKMLEAGNGARGIVFGSRGPNEAGHVFNVVNQNGVVRFLDGQTGSAATFSGYQSFHLLMTN
jgi:filamentous hemagglutinin